MKPSDLQQHDWDFLRLCINEGPIECRIVDAGTLAMCRAGLIVIEAEHPYDSMTVKATMFARHVLNRSEFADKDFSEWTPDDYVTRSGNEG